MTLMEEIEKLKNEGYNEANGQARVCQDIILYAISKDVRRATQDIDLDFIKYSIAGEFIETFIQNLNLIGGLSIFLNHR